MIRSPESQAKLLPSPAERPGSTIVIYDGQCQFCTAQVRRLERWDKGQRLSFLSLHDSEVGRRFPDLTHEQMMAEMIVITPDGKRFGGADGFRYLTLLLPRLWLLAPLLNFPGMLPVWSWLYRQVAIRRYRWNKKDECGDACEIHFRRK